MCAPLEWASGSWVLKRDAVHIVSGDGVHGPSGFLGCASTRNASWHLGTDREEELNWRSYASSYDYVPGGLCGSRMARFSPEKMVIDLVQNGGWLLVGDSVTEQHFFSISCSLYPHVIEAPNNTDRLDGSQNLYLNPNSSLANEISIPSWFDIENTPLVTFRRVDLLFNRTEIEFIHNGITWRSTAPSENATLFSKDLSWDVSPTEYLSTFFSPPPFNYHTLILSTGGQWSPTVFAGLEGGYPAIYQLFRTAITNWVYQAGRSLDLHSQNPSNDWPRSKEIIIRPHLPGDNNCHSLWIKYGCPLAEPLPFDGEPQNWPWIPRMNEAFEDAVTKRGHPRIHYLPIDRPGRMRPDAHLPGDCVHLAVGAGIIEGWTHYIYHYMTSYLPWSRRWERMSR